MLKKMVFFRYSILDHLSEMAADKGNASAREGALMAYEQLFNSLGSKFEPYVVPISYFLLSRAGFNFGLAVLIGSYFAAFAPLLR